MFLARKVFDFFYRFLQLAKVIFQRNNIKIIPPNQDVRFISGSVKFKYPENIIHVRRDDLHSDLVSQKVEAFNADIAFVFGIGLILVDLLEALPKT